MNKTIKIVFIVLACLALSLVVVYAACTAPPQEQPNPNNSSGPADRVDVVYFHRTQRCPTCIYAEEQTRYTLETYFKDELDSGKVTFQSINVQDEANADILEKYNNPSYLTLCINTVRDGTDHIEEVTDIWLVIGDDEAFVEIVKSKVEKSLSGEV
jgi:thiol-disulfide isomerase/thioredoxin